MAYHFLIINGPNLNLLGMREPSHYGEDSYEDLLLLVSNYCQEMHYHVDFYQSNHEGDLVDKIQEAYYAKVDGIVINPAAYTHTSIALLDALKAVMIPAVEVHISDLSQREDFRQVSYVREACIATISGHGQDGYIEAIEELVAYLETK